MNLHQGCRLVQNGCSVEPGQLRFVGMGQRIGLPHLVQRGFGHSANALCRIRIENFDGSISASTYFLAANAHGIELMISDKLGNLTHDNHLLKLQADWPKFKAKSNASKLRQRRCLSKLGTARFMTKGTRCSLMPP